MQFDEQNPPALKIYSCVVIGSGISGLQTAYSLQQSHGLRAEDVLVLEAQDYIGGRVKQVTSFIKGVNVDVGAEFLHGSNTELTRFADEHNEHTKEMYCWAHGDGGPLQHTVDQGYGLYYVGSNSDNSRLLRYDSTSEDFVKLNESLWSLADLNEDDYSDEHSLLDYLSSLQLSDDMVRMAEAGYANTLCSTAKDLSLRRVIKWSRLWHAEGEEDGDFSLDNSYGCVVDILRRACKIEINSPVREICYADTLVALRTVGGVEYVAKCAVVTSSPHVLKSGLMRFDPPLSQELQASLSTTCMHNIVKVIMKFKHRPWPKHLSGMVLSDSTFLLPEIWFKDVSDKTAPGEEARAYAVGFTTAAYADKVATMSKDEVLRSCVEQLDVVFSHLEPQHMSGSVDGMGGERPDCIPKPSEEFLDGMLWEWNPIRHPYIGTTSLSIFLVVLSI
jgi:monoamine oxidase